MTEIIKAGYTRVTEILKPFGDFSHIPPEVLAKAADRGTRVHTYCEEYARLAGMHAQEFFELSTIDSDCRPYVKSFIDWYSEMVAAVHLQEQRLYSEYHKFCGKPDMIVSLKSDLATNCLVDLKTPQVPVKSWQLQSAAYHLLLNENSLFTTLRRFSLILDKNGGPARVIEYSNYHKDRILFLSALKLYNFFNCLPCVQSDEKEQENVA